jgi:hypothetical protein
LRRSRFPGDREFGQWVKKQGFPFVGETARLYRLAAENEEAIRAALESQLTSGPQNFEKAVKAVLHPPVDPARRLVVGPSPRRGICPGGGRSRHGSPEPDRRIVR